MKTEDYLSFLKEGINNYEYMVRKLRKSVSSEHVLCSYSFLIHMGDLFRYIYLEEPKNSESFASSQECYLKAIRCDSCQGNAYHQLAVLASYKKSYCQALYYCIRAITCPSPFSTAFSNIPYHFAENSKNLAKSQSMYPALNKHHCNEVFPAIFTNFQKLLLQFVDCCSHLYHSSPHPSFAASLSQFASTLNWCLEQDKPSSTVMVRMLAIAIFSAEDLWSCFHREGIFDAEQRAYLKKRIVTSSRFRFWTDGRCFSLS